MKTAKQQAPTTCPDCRRNNRRAVAAERTNAKIVFEKREAVSALAESHRKNAALENERRAAEKEDTTDRHFIESLAVRLGWGPHVDWEDHETHITDRVERLLHLEANDKP